MDLKVDLVLVGRIRSDHREISVAIRSGIPKSGE